MPRFAYAGVTFSGQAVSGEVKARDQDGLRSSLRRKGVLLLEARPLSSASRLAGLGGSRRFHASVTRYYRHLATLVGAGVPLSKALDGLADRAEGVRWRQVLEDIAERVKKGSSMADAIASQSGVFAGVAVPMIAAAERSGRLPEILERIAGYREKAETLTRKVRGALVYPAVVSVVAVVVIWIMLTQVVPVFTQMFANLGAELPQPTRILLSISDGVRYWAPGAVLAALIGLGSIQAVRARPAGRLALSRLLLRSPIVGDTLGKIAVSRVARTAATLLENGVALLPALQTAAKTAGNAAVERVFQDAAGAVERGRPLSEPLGATRDIPHLAVQILSTGEETANMGQMFGKLADFYESEADATVGVVTSVLEPALVVLMGIIVAGILIALYLPMFEVLGQIGG